MQTFQDDDVGYRKWLWSHLDGYVVNAQRGSNPGEPILHKGDVRHNHADSRPRVDEGLHQSLLDRPIRTRCVGALARTAIDLLCVVRPMTAEGQLHGPNHL